MEARGATKRLIKEYTEWLKAPVTGVYLKPNPCDLFTWSGAFEGPRDTPYEGGVYLLEVTFPKDYPFKVSPFERERLLLHPLKILLKSI